MKQTPHEIYKKAVKERSSSDPLTRRDACEKGWLAVMEAIDAFLATHGLHVPKGTAEAHTTRIKLLNTLVDTVPNAEKLTKLLSLVADQLHGACFYGGADVPYFTHILEKDVKEVLNLTGFWNGAEE